MKRNFIGRSFGRSGEAYSGNKSSDAFAGETGKGQLVPDASALDILNCETYDRWAKECADEGVTLVKIYKNFFRSIRKTQKSAA